MNKKILKSVHFRPEPESGDQTLCTGLNVAWMKHRLKITHDATQVTCHRCVRRMKLEDRSKWTTAQLAENPINPS